MARRARRPGAGQNWRLAAPKRALGRWVPVPIGAPFSSDSAIGRTYPFHEAHRDGTPRGMIECGGAPLIRRARGGSASGAAAARLGRIARERQRRRGDGVGRRCGRLDVDVGQLGLPRANDDGAKPWLEGSSRLPPILRGELEHSQL